MVIIYLLLQHTLHTLPKRSLSYTVRRQMKVDKRGGNGKRQFSKLFHLNHLGYVQINQKSLS